ncbi:DNA-binding protein [Streptococcus minor]|uniref:DNA-binding protein n=1 Tax=Streptococcus minor TaxID=229549 RepID=A0A3P1VF78_9STRE|nr:SatD family protein [Streptococcus minor]RRD32347.1 DNA-binding protein [Streptococcus minor]
MLYIALIGDMIDSKDLPNRSEFQQQLKNCLAQVNITYQMNLASKFSITLGDEFQGLLLPDAPVFHIIDDINRSMEGVSLRFGIGLGEIVTDIDPEISLGADGSSYWYAREAINYIHQKNDYGNTQLAVRMEDKAIEVVVNSLLAASEAIKASWRESQLTLLNALLQLGIYEEQFEQQTLSQYLNLTPSALSKRLKSSSIKVYLRARKEALKLLQVAMEK